VRSGGGQGRGGLQRLEQERAAAGAGEGGARSRGGRRGGFIWGEMEKKGKKKIEIGKFTKKPYLKLYLFL
jgi:hypothetical protein